MNTRLTVLLSALCITTAAWAAEYEVGQEGKKFSVDKLEIKVGDSVKFTNQDSFFHNVYSLSDLKTFDLGSYPKGEFRTVTFDKAGVIPVECAIHPNMYMEIHVK